MDSTPAEHPWTINSGTPDTSITSKPAKLTNSRTATFQFTGTPASPTFQCELDQVSPPGPTQDFDDCSGPGSSATYTDLAPDPTAANVKYKFSVRAVSGALSDPTPATYEWEIDNTLPTPKTDGNPKGPGASPPELGVQDVRTSTRISRARSPTMPR